MKPRTLTLLSGVILLLVPVAAAIGIFSQATGAPIHVVTVRGEHATYQGSGLYRYDPALSAREAVIWDVIQLCLALLLFALAIVLAWRGSLRGRLLLCGLLFYIVYVYLQAATGDAFNPLFLVYVAIFALSTVAFFLNLPGIDVSGLPAHLSARFPRWLFIGLTLVIGTALIVLWVGGRIIPYTLAGRFPDEEAGMTTLIAQAFDLGMLVPLLLSTALLLWRRSAWGYLLAGISMTVGFMMSITIPAFIAVPLIQAGQLTLLVAAALVLACLVGLYGAARFFWSVRQVEGARPRRAMATV
jgi:hypothetical protein